VKKCLRMGVLMGLGLLSAAAAGPRPAGWPRPALAWAAGPMEVRIAFESAADAGAVEAVVGTKITLRERGEEGREGSLSVAAAKLVDDGRTLVLVTDPHPRPADYSLTLPGTPPVRLTYALEGVEVRWAEGENDPEEGAEPAGWWPVLDPAEALRRTRGSAEHKRLFGLLAKPGRLSVRGSLALPAGQARIEADASAPFKLTYGTDEAGSAPGAGGRHLAALDVEATGDALDLGLMVQTGTTAGSLPSIRVTLTREGGAGRPIDGSTLIPSWVPPAPPKSPEATPPPSLAGGDRARGEAVFHGEQAKCSNCHAVAGKGAKIGPALDDVGRRGAPWIYRQIADPSAEIHPDYATYTVALKEGRVVVGTVRAEGADSINVSDIDAKSVTIGRSEVEEMRPSGASIMPVGLAGAIGEAKMRDLIAYLLEPRPAR
jgi:putative heme-binding domain-containing protein